MKDFFKAALFLFLFLAFFITLFPPTSFGEDYLKASDNKLLFRSKQLRAKDLLPIYERSFLLSSGTKQFKLGYDYIPGDKYGVDKAKSVPVILNLNRSILFGELLLNYLVAAIMSLLVLFSIDFFHTGSRRKKL